jgi:CBS domain containing-hemolysin-like protein
VDLIDQAEAFQNLRIGDVMTPRADITALEISLPLDEVVRRFISSELTRLPIYRETLDDPVGVVHIKDIVRLFAPPEEGDVQAMTAPWREPVLHRLRREVLYVPASMRCADLMVRMRISRIHMALVIDEFGGVDGLVTLEDLLEAVVGEIDDEHDADEAPELVMRAAGVIEADARAPLEDLEQAIGIPLQLPDEDEEVDTVAGLVATLAGRVPQRGEVIIHPSGYEFEVTDADPRRIRRLRIRPPSPASEAVPPGASA